MTLLQWQKGSQTNKIDNGKIDNGCFHFLFIHSESKKKKIVAAPRAPPTLGA